MCENWGLCAAWKGIEYNPGMDRSLMRYTLIFLTRGDLILMLKRRKAPNQGLWNGIGGHIEPGEDPLECALREVREETGYSLDRLDFAGILTWDGFETPPGGLYIFHGQAPPGEPQDTEEGTLAWKSREWVLSNEEVVSNIHVFGPRVFDHSGPCEYYFHYHAGKIAHFEFRELPADLT